MSVRRLVRSSGRLGTVVAGALTVGALTAGAAACGYQASEVRPIEAGQLFGLDETTSTTTTTTTTTTTISSTVPPPSESQLPTTAATTTTVVATEPVELFYLDGTRITSISTNLASPVSLWRVLDTLVRGPNLGPAGIGLRSVLPRGVVNTVSRTGGVATVDLVPEAYERIRPEEELPAIAQIVLTLTRQSGVGQVRFTLGGTALPVRLGNNRVTAPGQPVSADDYANLLSEDVPTSAPPDTADTAARPTTTTTTPQTNTPAVVTTTIP